MRLPEADYAGDLNVNVSKKTRSRQYEKYTLGIDYGSLSGRSVIVDVETGEEVAYSVLDYPHAVMSESIPDGTPLPPDWALQHPQDYIDVLKETVPDVMKKANVTAEQIIGVGIDFTACTLIPIKKTERRFVSLTNTRISRTHM